MTGPVQKTHVIEVELTDYELLQLMVIVDSSNRPDICTVENLLQFHIDYLCENAFFTCLEPPAHGN